MDASVAADAGAARLAPEAFAERAKRIETEIGKVIVGQQDLVRHTLVGLLANSHVLLEGVPGLGKTMLIRTIGDVIDCTFNRIQFTPDLMPADITGTNILVEEGGSRVFKFQPGPIFANLVLADEINRATPEDAVVAARGDAGAPGHGRAQPLHARPAVLRPGDPEPARDGGHLSPPRGAARPVPAQGDGPLPVRGGPDLDPRPHDRLRRADGRRRPPRPPRSSRCSASRAPCPIAPHITAYAVSLLAATHPDNKRAPGLVRQYVRYGGSPRGAQALVTAGKILALMDGRFNVAIDDVRAAALPALRHRVILNFEGEAEGITSEAVVRSILDEVTPPAVE